LHTLTRTSKRPNSSWLLNTGGNLCVAGEDSEVKGLVARLQLSGCTGPELTIQRIDCQVAGEGEGQTVPNTWLCLSLVDRSFSLHTLTPLYQKTEESTAGLLRMRRPTQAEEEYLDGRTARRTRRPLMRLWTEKDPPSSSTFKTSAAASEGEQGQPAMSTVFATEDHLQEDRRGPRVIHVYMRLRYQE